MENQLKIADHGLLKPSKREPKTISQARQGKQISLISKENPRMAIMEVKGMIADLFRLVKVKRSIESHDEAEMIAALIVSEYWDLRISELQYIFRGIVTGRYGKVFDRLDANTICQFIREYQTSLERITYDEARASQHKAKRSEDELAMAYQEYRSSLNNGEQPLSYRDWFYQVRCKPIEAKPRKLTGPEYFRDPEYVAYKRRREELGIQAEEKRKEEEKQKVS